MPSYEHNPAREARAGAVTLAILLGTATLSAVLAKVSWQKPMIYRIGFRVNQDVSGVQPGTPVTLGGIEWGHVTRVQHGVVPAAGIVAPGADAARRGVTRGTLVTFEIDPRIRLMPGARICRTASFLGSGVELVITDTGLTRGSTDVLPLQGRDQLSEEMVLSAVSPAEGAVVVFGMRTASQLESIPESFGRVRASISEDLYGAATGRSPASPPPWVDRIDAIRASWSSLEALFAEPTRGGRTLGGDIDRMSDELKPAWDRTWTSMKDLADRATAEWDQRGERLWSRARTEWKRVEKLWDELKTSGDDSMDAYRDFMANGSLMGGQISRFFDEPVRGLLRYLFGRPGEKGLDRVARFEAASRLAIATADLRDAVDALEWLAAGSKSVDPALSTELRAQATRAVEAFAAAIERLVKLSQQP